MFHRVEGLLGVPPLPSPSLRILSPGAASSAETPAALLDLVAWWESKAAGGLPDRGAIDPVEFGRHLPSMALLDVEEDDFRFRLAGEEIGVRYGALRGRSLGELLTGNARTEALSEHRTCVASRRPTLARRSEPTPDGTDSRRYWRLLLPFAREGRTAAILAAMQFDPWTGAKEERRWGRTGASLRVAGAGG